MLFCYRMFYARFPFHVFNALPILYRSSQHCGIWPLSKGKYLLDSAGQDNRRSIGIGLGLVQRGQDLTISCPLISRTFSRMNATYPPGADGEDFAVVLVARTPFQSMMAVRLLAYERLPPSLPPQIPPQPASTPRIA